MHRPQDRAAHDEGGVQGRGRRSLLLRARQVPPLRQHHLIDKLVC